MRRRDYHTVIVLLKVMGRPRAEDARADHRDMVFHAALVGCREGRRNGCAAPPDDGASGALLQNSCPLGRHVLPAQPALAAAVVAVEEEEAAAEQLPAAVAAAVAAAAAAHSARQSPLRIVSPMVRGWPTS